MLQASFFLKVLISEIIDFSFPFFLSKRKTDLIFGLLANKLSFPFLTKTSISEVENNRFNSEITGVDKITSPKNAVCIINIFFTRQK